MRLVIAFKYIEFDTTSFFHGFPTPTPLPTPLLIRKRMESTLTTRARMSPCELDFHDQGFFKVVHFRH